MLFGDGSNFVLQLGEVESITDRLLHTLAILDYHKHSVDSLKHDNLLTEGSENA